MTRDASHIFRQTPAGLECRICGEVNGHYADCQIRALLREMEEIAGAVAAYVSDMREAVQTSEAILKGLQVRKS